MPSFSLAMSRIGRFFAACEISMSERGFWCCEAGMVGSIKWKGQDEARISRSSCPALCRASTPFFLAWQGVDGRDKPGHDVEGQVNLALAWRLVDFAHSPASIFLPSAG